MLEIARKNVSCRLIESAAEHLPFDDGSFDTILCLFTVLNLCDCDKALAEFYRVLKPGGKLILSVASVWENGGKLVRRFRIDGYILRFHLFKAEELKAAIEQAGFGIAHFDSIFRATRPRWGDWQSKVVEDLKQPAERGAMYLYVLGKPVSPV
jgi:SAM-dependent methyltransferase